MAIKMSYYKQLEPCKYPVEDHSVTQHQCGILIHMQMSVCDDILHWPYWILTNAIFLNKLFEVT